MTVSANEEKVLARAARIMEREVKALGDVMDSPQKVKDMIKFQIGLKKEEEFGILMLNNRHALIANLPLFKGDLSSCSVYPRQILSEVLKHNCAAVVLYHQHPSLISPAPSDTDQRLTNTVQQLLNQVQVRTLDHIIISGNSSYSFAEHGLL